MIEGTGEKLVLIASSTGGPSALHQLVPALDKHIDAPVVIVQHMPQGFTASLAERLNGLGAIPVSETKDGEVLKKGHVYLAQGGRHLVFIKDKQGNLRFAQNDDAPVNGLRPCANITFSSVCQLPLDLIVCVVLTGMGSDGLTAIKELRKRQHVYTIAQNKDTCTVYGMPKAVVDSGMADAVLPLGKIGKEIILKTGVHENGFKSIS